MKPVKPIPNSSLGTILSEMQRINPEFSKVITLKTGIPASNINKAIAGKSLLTKDQLIILAPVLKKECRTLMSVYLNERIGLLKQQNASARRIENMEAELGQINSKRFEISAHIPRCQLASLVESIIYYSGNYKTKKFERVLPDGVIQLMIGLDSKQRVRLTKNDNEHSQALAAAWIAGAQKKPGTYILPEEERLLIVRFKPGGFYALTGIPASEITDHCVAADQIFGSSITFLREQLLTHNNTDQYFRDLKNYFLNLYKTRLNAGQNGFRIHEDQFHIPVEKLVENTGFSHKHIIQIFKKEIGIPPKLYQRILRFTNSLNELLSLTQTPDWFDIVNHHGYYDQPHFINEFRNFTGFAPRSFLETGSTCSKFLHFNSQR